MGYEQGGTKTQTEGKRTQTKGKRKPTKVQKLNRIIIINADPVPNIGTTAKINKTNIKLYSNQYICT